MPTLRIQHAVPNYEGWKQAFDKDPMDRKASGVRSYHVYRSMSDPGFVMIDLEFDSRTEADAMHERLRTMWAGPGRAVMQNPEAWVVESVESRAL